MDEPKPLELGDRELVAERLRSHPPQVSELTFCNLYVWRYYRPVRRTRADGALLFFESYGGERHVLGPPVGEVDLPALLRELRTLGVTSFHRIPRETADALAGAGLRVEPDRDNFDYVYRRRDLVELAGRKYHRQQNLVNRCLSSYECEYVELGPENAGEVAEMIERWFGERELEGSPGLAEEYWALRETLRNCEDFALRGGAVRIDGRIEAFSIGEPLNDETAVVHFEKAMTRFTGLYQVINKWFCERGLEGFEFVNREQDLGIPGLRKAKESYHPHHMVEKFIARPHEA